MKIKIVCSWNKGLCGVFTSAVDLYYNLKKYINVEFCLYIESKEMVVDCIRHLFQNNNKDLLDKIIFDSNIEADLIICTANVIYKNISLNCNKLFILDSLELISNNYILPKLDNDNTILFCNPANMCEDIHIKQIEYYHKFNKKRLKNLPKHYKASLSVLKQEMFLHEIYNYNRVNKPHLEIEVGIFFENIGKRIFEHLYHNKIVNYNSEGLIKLDGLFYYLKHLGINGLINHFPLKISEQIIKEKLFMNENDKLLNLIKD